MPHNSMDLYEPGKCAKCGEAIRNHYEPFGFCNWECHEEYHAAEAALENEEGEDDELR